MREPGLLQDLTRDEPSARRLWFESPAPRWLAPLAGRQRPARRHASSVASTRRRSSSTRTASGRAGPTTATTPTRCRRSPEVRRLLLDGAVEEAHTLAELSMFGMPHRQASYQVLGDMTLLFGGHHEELVHGLPPLARPRRRDRRGRVRARRRRGSGARSSRACPTTSSSSASKRRRRGRSKSGRTSTAATTPSSAIDGSDHVIGGVVGARGTAFSRPRTSARRGRHRASASETTSPFAMPTP